MIIIAMMKITKKEGIKLMQSDNPQDLISFIYEYAIFKGMKKQEIDKIMPFMNFQLIKRAVTYAINKYFEENDISIIKVIDLKTNKIIKIF